MITEKTAQERVDYSKKHGFAQTLKHFQITKDTLKRYLRRVQQKTLEDLPAPKILVFDVETAPILLYAWEIFKPRPTHLDIYKDWFMFSWSAKWLLEDEIFSDVLTPEDARAGNDARICKSIWNLIDEADIIIAHNAKRFDVRKINARFMLNGEKPPSPYTVIDTLTESRKAGAHTSHRLDHLSTITSGRGKLETPKGLWKECYAGIPESLLLMEKYNREDVIILEDFYLFLRPWIKNHPNVGLYLYSDVPRCAACGSKSIYEDGIQTTNVGVYRTFRCTECSALSKERKSSFPLENRKVLLTSATK